MDTIPAVRRATLDTLATQERLTTAMIAEQTRHPEGTIRRALEELHLLGALDRSSSGAAHTWRLTAWTKDRYEPNLPVPEKSRRGRLPTIEPLPEDLL